MAPSPERGLVPGVEPVVESHGFGTSPEEVRGSPYVPIAVAAKADRSSVRGRDNPQRFPR